MGHVAEFEIDSAIFENFSAAEHCSGDEQKKDLHHTESDAASIMPVGPFIGQLECLLRNVIFITNDRREIPNFCTPIAADGHKQLGCRPRAFARPFCGESALTPIHTNANPVRCGPKFPGADGNSNQNSRSADS